MASCGCARVGPAERRSLVGIRHGIGAGKGEAGPCLQDPAGEPGRVDERDEMRRRRPVETETETASPCPVTWMLTSLYK